MKGESRSVDLDTDQERQSTNTRKVKMRSHNHFCRPQAGIITHSEYVSVAFIVQHAMGMCRIIICDQSGSTVFFHVISYRSQFSEDKLLQFFLKFCLAHFSF